jgi:tetratricopeptide (TPR) repeat protein
MTRTGAPPDPLTATDPAGFITRLRQLRAWAGDPSLRRLCERAGTTVDARGRVRDALPVSTISYVLRGSKLPRMDFVRTYVDACLALREPAAGDRPADQLDRWRDAWLAVRSRGDGVGPDRPVPRQLPIEPGTFTGRAAELRSLLEILRPSARGGPAVVAALHGPGGIGKSALAIRAAHRLAGRYPDGQLYVDLRGATVGLTPLEPVDVLGRFLRDLGFRGSLPARPDEAAARFRSEVAGRRVLMLLDNAVGETQVRPLLPGSPGCAVLVTSRPALPQLAGARQVPLSLLPESASVELLGRLAGPDRVVAEPAAAAEVARLCGQLPLALRIAGARLAVRPGWPVQALAARLAREQRRLDELELPDASVRASFAVSYRQLRDGDLPLDRAAAEAFALLGAWTAMDVSLPVAARLLDRPEAAAEPLLERLVDARLLETPAPGRYRLHDLLRLYAGEQAALTCPEPVRLAARTRALRFVAATAWRSLPLMRPGSRRLSNADHQFTGDGLPLPDLPAALAWLEAERANLTAAVSLAATDDKLAGFASQISEPLAGFFLTRGYWREWEKLSRVALAAAIRTGDRAAAVRAQDDLGNAYLAQGWYDEAVAHHRRGLAGYRELGDRDGEAASLSNLGIAHHQQGDLDQALACHQASLAIHRELGDRRSQAGNLTNLGAWYGQHGRYACAEECFHEALVIYHELGDLKGQSICLNNLGEACLRQHRHHDALRSARQALELSQRLHDRWGQAKHELLLGSVHYAQERHAEALRCYRRSLAICRDLGSRPDEAEALRHIGTTLSALGRGDVARDHWWQALAIYEDLRLPAAAELRLRLEPGRSELAAS